MAEQPIEEFAAVEISELLDELEFSRLFDEKDIPLLLDEVKLGFLLLSEKRRIIYANNWFLDALQQFPADVIGRSIDEIFPEPITGRLTTAIDEALVAGRSSMLTTRLNKSLFPLTSPDGNTMHQRVMIKPFGHNDEFRRCTIRIEDVTETFIREQYLKQKRKEAESDRAYLDAIMQGTAEGFVTIDSAGIIETFNPAAEAMFGYSSREVIGKNVAILMSEDERAAHDGYVRNSEIYAPRIINKARDLYGLRKDGTLFPMELNVSRIEISGRVVFVGIIRDIAEKTEVARLKSEFVSTVSHELRTPLTSIKGALGLIASGALGELSGDVTRLIEIADKNSGRLISLVNDILDMDKLESGNIVLDSRELDITSLVADAVESNIGFAEEHDVNFVLGDNADGQKVHGDESRLAQVLANLLSNAAKFSPAGESVEVTVVSANGLTRVAVSDHGSGIPDNFREHIFERFSQADGSDVRQKGGSGLGLNISKLIVEMHDGEIGFDSEVGVGSTFFFNLPTIV